jgi:hypothetical protein
MLASLGSIASIRPTILLTAFRGPATVYSIVVYIPVYILIIQVI